PPRRPPEGPSAPAAEKVADKEWLALNHDALQKEMAKQKARPPRIRVPAWEEVRKVLPPGYPKDRPTRIRWSLVCLGYQPELAAAWFKCIRTFGREANQDRVFEESLFWVITRSLHCFY